MFTNKVIIITGASGGLGRALSIALAKLQANLVLFSRNQKELDKTVELCNAENILAIVGDVTKPQDCEQLTKQAIKKFGQIDILINNAGISQWQKFEDSDLTTQHQLMQTNYFGAVNCTHYALPYLKKSKGMIVAISSVQGKLGVPYHTGYCASKHALQGFFSSLRNEMNKQIDVLIVSPSWIFGTNLRTHAIGGRNKEASAKKHGTDINDMVTTIIQAIKKRRKQLILPAQLKLLIVLKNIFPNFVNKILTKAITKENH